MKTLQVKLLVAGVSIVLLVRMLLTAKALIGRQPQMENETRNYASSSNAANATSTRINGNATESTGINTSAFREQKRTDSPTRADDDGASLLKSENDTLGSVLLNIGHIHVQPTGPMKQTPTLKKSKALPSYNPKKPLPAWSKILPRTQFTDHVVDLVLNLTTSYECPITLHLVANASNNMLPTVNCGSNPNPDFWCGTVKRIFATRPLPYNVSIGFDTSDSFRPNTYNNSCLGNSSPGGRLTLPNMQQLIAMIENERFANNPTRYKYPYRDDVPWNERDPTPVFRGTLWKLNGRDCKEDGANLTYQGFLENYPIRFRVVDFSVDHPDLLNARPSKICWTLKDCFAGNATNGLSKLLPFNKINSQQYYERYQVAFVVKGIGAAYRLSVHMMTRTAVLLQACDVEEWFTPYLKPYVHYIPVATDLSNLKESLEWILAHPKEVQQIGENGRIFYERYLTFTGHDQHIYEFFYRLSEYRHAINI